MTNAPPQSIDLPNLDQLANLFLVAQTLVDGVYQGRHASPDRGGSTEFYDYRMYSPGDSVARVDWKVFGRTDRLYIRRFQHFGNLTLHLIVDGSASMNFADLSTNHDSKLSSSSSFPACTKWKYATQLAAAFALLAVRQSEQVALGIAQSHLTHAFPPLASWTHLYHMVHALETIQPAGVADITTALQDARSLVPRRRMVFILSDFLSPIEDWRDAIQRLRFEGNDVACLQILTPTEMNLAGVEANEFTSFEDTTVRVRSNVREISRSYAHLMQQHIDGVRTQLTALGVDHVLALTNEHPLSVLRSFLWSRAQDSRRGLTNHIV